MSLTGRAADLSGNLQETERSSRRGRPGNRTLKAVTPTRIALALTCQCRTFRSQSGRNRTSCLVVPSHAGLHIPFTLVAGTGLAPVTPGL